MGIKWGREMKGQAKEKKWEAMEMKERHRCMQKRWKWQRKSRMDESLKSRGSVSVIVCIVETAD